MFYLRQSLKMFVKAPIRFLCFFSASILMLLVCARPSYFADHLVQQQQSQERSYFHALIDGTQNSSRLARNLNDVPGVFRVEQLSQDVINEQVAAILGSLKVDLPKDIMELNYNGLKVYLTADISEHNQTLIRDYMVRLVGESMITLGATVHPAVADKIESRWSYWLPYLPAALVILAAGLWFGALALVVTPIKKYSYLIEQFQRRRFVATKTYGVMLAFILSLGVMGSLAFFLSSPSWPFAIAIALLLMPIVQLKKRYIWSF